MLQEEVEGLCKANEQRLKRKSCKRKFIQAGGSMIVGDAVDLIAGKGASGEGEAGESSTQGGASSGPVKKRLCSNRGRPGHNVRTCIVLRTIRV